MALSSDRRTFLSTTTLGLGGLTLLNALPTVTRAESHVDPKLVRLDAGIEPLVRLLEETPRDKLLEEVAARVKKGTSFREVVTALLLAGVLNIQPRPSVGFKFHAVLVVNAAHQAALAGPDGDRWLPIFWALDNFKGAQTQNAKETGWRMKPVDEAHVPAGRNAKAAFAEAMANWDEEKADVAAAALARFATTGEAFDEFARFGCRDFRDIGHKAIYVANAFRTLHLIGWHHAEPVLRSLALALLRRDGAPKPTGELAADLVGIRNAELARTIGANWQEAAAKPEAVPDVLALIRQADEEEVGKKVAALANGLASPQTLWDAIFLGGGELLMRQPGVIGLHTLTTANALRYAYETTSVDETRKLLLLQAASFLPMFRKSMGNKIAEARIDSLAEEGEKSSPTVEAVFSALSKDKAKAAKMALGLLAGRPEAAKELIDAGRRLIFLKGTDAHDYKFSTAVMEDAARVSPAWRHRFLAASLFWLKGSAGPDSALVGRTRTALN